MRIYLAGPMRGHPEYNFPAFHAAAKVLRERGHTVFNPAEKGCESEVTKGGDEMNTLSFRRKVFGMDTDYICRCADAVAMLPNWEQSRGAVAEKALADALGIRVLYLGQEDGWHVSS
jgi:hypothetical protein